MNQKFEHRNDICLHLIGRDFIPNYDVWNHHEEDEASSSDVNRISEFFVDKGFVNVSDAFKKYMKQWCFMLMDLSSI